MKLFKYIEDALIVIVAMVVFLFIAAPTFDFEERPPVVPKCGFKAVLENPLDIKVIYSFVWVDHGFPWAYPMSMAGGEIQPKKFVELTTRYQCGVYFIRWSVGGKEYTEPFTHYAKDGDIRVFTAERVEE